MEFDSRHAIWYGVKGDSVFGMKIRREGTKKFNR